MEQSVAFLYCMEVIGMWSGLVDGCTKCRTIWVPRVIRFKYKVNTLCLVLRVTFDFLISSIKLFIIVYRSWGVLLHIWKK